MMPSTTKSQNCRMNVAALDSCQEMVLIFIIPLRIARSSSHQIAHGDTTMFIVQDIDCIEAIAKDPQHFRQIVVFLVDKFRIDNSLLENYAFSLLQNFIFIYTVSLKYCIYLYFLPLVIKFYFF